MEFDQAEALFAAIFRLALRDSKNEKHGRDAIEFLNWVCPQWRERMNDNKKMNEFIRRSVGATPTTPKPLATTANAGSGTEAPPPTRPTINDWIRNEAKRR